MKLKKIKFLGIILILVSLLPTISGIGTSDSIIAVKTGAKGIYYEGKYYDNTDGQNTTSKIVPVTWEDKTTGEVVLTQGSKFTVEVCNVLNPSNGTGLYTKITYDEGTTLCKENDNNYITSVLTNKTEYLERELVNTNTTKQSIHFHEDVIHFQENINLKNFNSSYSIERNTTTGWMDFFFSIIYVNNSLFHYEEIALKIVSTSMSAIGFESSTLILGFLIVTAVVILKRKK